MYPFVVTQEKRRNLESSFWDSMVVKEKKKSILGSSWFEIFDNTMMSTLSQNRDYFKLFSQVKSHTFFKLRNSGIQRFKWIAIQSWNEGDMVNWSNVTQRACCYGIAYGSNSFWLFGLNFRPLLMGLFWWQLRLLGFQFWLTLSLVVGLFLIIWILSKF